ncbi:hypothetical protein AB0M43_36835 [Longispora sp. NPDC051575]|uniref:hypothetical protein n=1 Tax=Longispora sp. NPDC051575 TaxID=3154943 RepID=UPI0034203B23
MVSDEWIAAAAASSLMSAAATQTWEPVRRQIAALFTHGGDRDEGSILRRLDESASDLEAISADQRDRARLRLAADWQVRIRDLLDTHPDLAGHLRDIIDELRSSEPRHWNVTAVTVHAQSVVQYGAVYGDVRVTQQTEAE